MGFVVVIFLSGCLDLEKESQIGISDQEYELAVPLINSKITVGKVAEASDGNTTIRIDADGKSTVLYNGEVIRKSSSAIFPPLPGLLFPNVITDTLTNVKLDFNNLYLLKKAVFRDTKVQFSFSNNLASDVKINMSILELTKDGKVFEKDFLLKYNNTLPTKFTSEEISINDWTLESESNSLTFHYVATLPNGEKIKLDDALMTFDVIKFSYLEGYLGYHEFAVEGSIIDVGLFNNWLSGSFDFENPKISLSVKNAFGLPVRSKVNKMELTSITGKTVKLESEFIDTGIDFAYPSFSEIGTIKTTNFVFDKTNSNIREVFNEKTKTIAYDIDALVNVEKDTTIKGFVTESSYFVVNVAVEVPLLGSINNVVITDTLDIDLGTSDEVISANFKSITSNDFPAELKVQAYFLDDIGSKIDKLFNNDGIVLGAAPLQENGITTPGSEKIDLLEFDKVRFDKIRKSKKLVLVASINTTGSEQKKSLWIYDNYGIGLKLGAIIKYKKS